MPDFFRLGEGIALVKNLEVIVAHFMKDIVVDISHALGCAECLAIAHGKGGGGILIEALCAVRDEVHHGEETTIVNATDEIALGILEARHVLEWDVDAYVVMEVLTDIAEDISELEGMTEGDRVAGGIWVLAAEDLDGNEAYAASDSVGVLFQLLPVAKAAVRGEVGLAACDEIEKELGIDRIAVADF